MSKIRVVVFSQDTKKAEVLFIENTLGSLQQIVGGPIECVVPKRFYRMGMHLYVHGEGKFDEACKPCLYIDELQDVIFGNIICSSSDGEGEEIGLTHLAINEAMTAFEDIKSTQEKHLDSLARSVLDRLIDEDAISPMYGRLVELYKVLRQ
jgi:hypothetical protein